ncbi:MAG TPA: hypothetical protein VFX16_14565 [Pseudonocardiaceae bacterium]|nr:hypothetical protein [Pseudonocardiaceae bacterium]
MRPLLVRALMVLGGAFAITAVGWLLCAGSASADTLPPVPVIPSVVAAVAPQLSTTDIDAPGIKAPEIRDLKPPALPLDGVTKQVHVTMSGVGAKVDKVEKAAPVVTLPPATDLPVHHTPAVVPPVVHQLSPAQPEAQRQHIAAPSVRMARTVWTPRAQQHPTAPLGAGHHTPLLPPLQPAGSSDSNAHGAGSVAGGAGSAHLPVTHVLGCGLNLACAPSTPRIAVAPGQQPGTSPD